MVMIDSPTTAPDARAAVPDAGPRLAVNPAVSVIRCSDDEVFLHHGSRSASTHRIEDTRHRGRFADFAAGFTSAATAREVGDRLGIDPDDAAEFAQHLRDGSALLTEDAARYGYVIAGLGAHTAPAVADVAVVGRGRVAASVARQLADLLDRPVDVADDVVEAFEANDLVVVAADRIDPGLFYDADEAATATGTPWQLVYVDGGEVIVGPTFVPGLTVGYYDLDTMDEAGRTMRMEYQYLKSAVPEVAATAAVPLLVADLAASYAGVAVLQHLTGKGSFLENHVLRVDLERLHVIRDRVIRLARTPRDLASRDDLRHPFL